MTSGVFVTYNERYGEELKPNADFWLSRVSGGRLVWGRWLWRSNRDGLSGLSTIADYMRAQLKILVFGDSFTQFIADEVTWPDLLRNNLETALSGSVSVLNYAREGSGVMQMLDLAADKTDELRPHYVIVAVIGDDFTRARRWQKEVERNGSTRWMVSTSREEFLDYRVALDHKLVDPSATKEWFDRSIAAADRPNAVLDRLNAQYRQLREDVYRVTRPLDPLTVSRSYLYTRLTQGGPFGRPNVANIPRISFDDYRQDERTVRNVERLKRTGARLLLVYLPLAREFHRARYRLDGQSERLLKSLEDIAHARFWAIHEHFTGALPAKLDLLPFDAHPNHEGLQVYADAITSLVLGDWRQRSADTATVRHEGRNPP